MKSYKVNYYWEGNLFQDVFEAESLKALKAKLNSLEINYKGIFKL